MDYGKRRIGLAISDATGMLARPWKTLSHDGAVDHAAVLLKDEISMLRNDPDGLAAVVLGFPRRLSGEANALTADVRQLGTMLRDLRITVVLQDERLSSHEAEQALAGRVKDWRKRKPLIDAAAAAIILQDYLDGLDRPALSKDDR